MPTYTPITPERRIVRQYLSTSLTRGITESTLSTTGRRARSDSTVRISEKPNAPISAGMSEMPPARSPTPNVKRLWAWMPSCPISVANRPAMPISQPFSGSLPAIEPDISTPNSASQKNSKAPNVSATSPSDGVSSARQTMPNSEPSHRAARRDAHRASRLALARELVAVEARRRVGGGARNVEQDRRAAAAVDRADVGADQDQDAPRSAAS